MELGLFAELQTWLIVFAVGLPSAWIMNGLYRLWRKANLPAFLAKQKQMRRRDAVIKSTRVRTTNLETALAAVQGELEALEQYKLRTEERLSKLETFAQQLKQKLKARGILFDA